MADDIRTIGSGGTYATIQAWNDAAPANLTSPATRWIGEILSSNDHFSELVTISGSTTDASSYKILRTATGASFRDHATAATNPLRYNEAFGCSLSSTTTFSSVLIVNENFARVEGLQVKAIPVSSSGLTSNNGGVRLDNLIVEAPHSGATVNLLGSATGTDSHNCLYISTRVGSLTGLAKLFGQSSMYNCTLVKVDTGVRATNIIDESFSSGTIRNTAIYGGNGVSDNTGTTFQSCHGDSGAHTGVTTTSITNAFVNATTDFRLKTGSALIGAGQNDAANAATDILGTSRTLGSYDVGCHQTGSALVDEIINTGIDTFDLQAAAATIVLDDITGPITDLIINTGTETFDLQPVAATIDITNVGGGIIDLIINTGTSGFTFTGATATIDITNVGGGISDLIINTGTSGFSFNGTSATISVTNIGAPPVASNVAGSNMSIIVKDEVPDATISATSGNATAQNLKSDSIAEVWQSSTGTATVTLSWSTDRLMGGVGLALTSLDQGDTVRVVVYSNTAATTVVYDDTTKVVDFMYDPPEGFAENDASSFAFGGGNYYSVFFDEVVARAVKITVVAASNPAISRVVAGRVWTGTYQVNMGASNGYNDSSTSTRSESGVMVVDRGYVKKRLSVNFSALTDSDKSELANLVKSKGVHTPIYMSVIPEAAGEERKAYEIYGTGVGNSGITTYEWRLHSSNLILAEV